MPKVKSTKSTKNLLSQFNSIQPMEYISVTKMVMNKHYRVTGLTRMKTKYGDRLSAELDHTTKVFLPERYNRMSDEDILEMGKGNYVLIKRADKGQAVDLLLVLANKQPVAQPVAPTAVARKATAVASKSKPEETDVEDDDDDDDEIPPSGSVAQKSIDFYDGYGPAASPESQYPFYVEEDQAPPQ